MNESEFYRLLFEKVEKAANKLAEESESTKKAHWIVQLATYNIGTGGQITAEKLVCSNCGRTNGSARTAYCPHCGKKMI